MIREIKLIKCQHCGTPFHPKEGEEFCCRGCYYVAQVLEDSELTRFYDLKGEKTVPPVGSKVFQDCATEWLEAIQIDVEQDSTSNLCTTDLRIEGISCLGCVWLIEAIFKRQTGASKIRIDPRTCSLGIFWIRNSFDLSGFANELQQIGYRLAPKSADDTESNATHQLTSRLGICGFFLMNTMLFTLPGYLGMGGDFFLAPMFTLLGALFASLSLIVGGGYFISRAWQALKTRVIHIDLPIAAGLLAAYGGSLVGCVSGYTSLIYFDFVATFVFLMLVGRWLQEFALSRNRAHLQKQHLGPKNVTMIGGAMDGQRLSVERVINGQEYCVEPGEINPVAADLIDPEGTLSLEWINGEAEPVVWSNEKPAPAGAINVGLHALRFRAREAWGESLLANLLQRPTDGFHNQRLQTILKTYIGLVLCMALIGAIAWFVCTGDVLKATQVLISILVVSCPCALGVALPMCDEFATARLRRTGLFIKSADIWERLHQVNTVVFDKTGTLTMDTPRLNNPAAIRELDPLSCQALFALVEHNVHPVARSLREALMAYHIHIVRNLPQEILTADICETIGQGVSWTDRGGNCWTLGKPLWQTNNSKRPQPNNAHSVLRQNGLLVAAFEFVEDVRDDARAAVDSLRIRKMGTAILSGDLNYRVSKIAQGLGLDKKSVKAECTPFDKANWIERHAPGSALMIGDGANDSLAFDKAICRGTPVVDRSILEASADFFFFGRSLRSLPALFTTASARRRTVSTVFITAVSYNLAAVGLCLAGLMHPLLAAILMPLSSIATLAISWIGLGRAS